MSYLRPVLWCMGLVLSLTSMTPLALADGRPDLVWMRSGVFQQDAWPTTLRYSRDGAWIAMVEGNNVNLPAQKVGILRIMRVSDGMLVRTITATGAVLHVAFAPNSRMLAWSC